MPFVGLDPERARDLSVTMRLGATDADGLSGDVTAALTLAELESAAPGGLLAISDELDQVGVVITTRANLVDGFIIDSGVLAVDLNISIEQAEAALAALDEVENGRTATITPFLEALAENRVAAEVLRNTFVGLPELGFDPEFDQALIRLAAFLPVALEDGTLPELDVQQVADLQLLAKELNTGAGGLVFLALAEISGGADSQGLEGLSSDGLQDFAELLFEKVAEIHELDSRLQRAAGLPTIADILTESGSLRASLALGAGTFDGLDEWLPAFLAGEGPALDDAEQLALAAELAETLGWDDDDGKSALDFLFDGRFLQRALIPGEFEEFDSPLIPITETGFGLAILAGERNGVLTEEGRLQIEAFTSQVLTNADGSDDPVELTEQQQQALIGIVVGQNGEDFINDPNIQRQLVAALNLIGRQDSLTQQQKLFADTIQAFRSLAVVGAPAMTYRQIKEAVGPEVNDELGYKSLTARSSKKVGKRPFYLALLTQWGVEGGDKIKTKKRKFKFEFDETGELVKIRKKKISKFKQFTNTLKAFGNAWVEGWKDNPFKALFETVKIGASVVASIFPATSAAGIAALTILAADTAVAIADGDVLGALSSGFGAIGGAAAYFGNVAVAGSTASLVSKGANLGQTVVDGVESADNLIDAIDDGDIFGIVGSGFDLLGNAADVVANGTDLVNDVGGAFTAGGEFLSGETFDTVVNTANEISTTADDLAGLTESVNNTVTAIENDDVLGAVIGGATVLGQGIQAGTNDAGILDDGLGLSEDFEGGVAAVGTSLVDLGAAATTGRATVEAIENDDLVGALSNGFRFAGDAANLVGNSKGAIGGAVGLEDQTTTQLADFGRTGSRQLAEAVELGGAAARGDVLDIIENSIDLGQLTPEGRDQLKAELQAADSALDVARVVERVYEGADVDLDKLYDEVNEALADVAEVGEAAAATPPVPPPVPQQSNVLQPPAVPGLPGTVVGQDVSGALLIDNNGDGVADVALRPAGGPPLGQTGGVEGPQDGGQPVGGPIQSGPRPVVEVRGGQVLSQLAVENGVTVDQILELNPQIGDPDQIAEGQTIELPTSATQTFYPSPERPAVGFETGGAFGNGLEQLQQNLAGGELGNTPLIELVTPPEFGPPTAEQVRRNDIETIGNVSNGVNALAEGVAFFGEFHDVIGPADNPMKIGIGPDLFRISPPISAAIEVSELAAQALDARGNLDLDSVGEQTAGGVGAIGGGLVASYPGAYFGEMLFTEAHQRFTYEPLIDVQDFDGTTVVSSSTDSLSNGYVPHGVDVSQVTVDDPNGTGHQLRVSTSGGEVVLNADQVKELLGANANLADWAEALDVSQSEAFRAARASERLLEDTDTALGRTGTDSLPPEFGGLFNFDSPLLPIENVIPYVPPGVI